MSDNALPNKNEVVNLLSGLLGDGVVVKDRPKPIDTQGPCVVAIYQNDSSSPRRALACDLRFANSAGAALSMISPGVAADATKAGEVPENIRSNLHEVFNICVNIFAGSHREHLTLGSVLTPENKPAEETQMLTKATGAISFDIDVPRYGAGSISLLALNG